MSQEGTARFWLAFTSALLIITIGADDASHATFSPWSRCRALRTNPAAVSVYAYPVPPVLTDDLIRCFTAERQYAPWSDGDPIGAPYTSDVLLHRAVLRHPGLTEDPSRADVFFLPFYGSVSTRLRRKCSGTDHRQRAALLARIARQSPWFARRAADHVAVFSHFDVCCRQQPSYLMQGGGPLQSVVVSSRMLVFQLDLWFPQSGGGAACERDFVHERFAGARERDACRVRVIPYAARRSLAVLEEELPRERHIFAFFAGNVNLAFCRGDLHASPWARHCKVCVYGGRGRFRPGLSLPRCCFLALPRSKRHPAVGGCLGSGGATNGGSCITGGGVGVADNGWDRDGCKRDRIILVGRGVGGRL